LSPGGTASAPAPPMGGRSHQKSSAQDQPSFRARASDTSLLYQFPEQAHTPVKGQLEKKKTG